MIDIPLVYKLLKEQHPDLADRQIQFVDEGLDNAMFRLGDLLSVKPPRREIAAKLIENEQTWLPPPRTVKSACQSPSKLSDRIVTRSATDCLKIPVATEFPFQLI